MNFLLCTDNNYVMPTGVLMHSIGRNNSLVRYYIIVSSDFSSENRNVLCRIADMYKCNIEFCPVPDNLTKTFPVGRSDQPQHITLAAYYRLFASEVLPDNIDRVIYLDCDMVVRKSLQALWETKLDEYAVGVVHDVAEPKQCTGNRLPYPMNTGYFNSGMLLINLEYWRKHNCFERFVSFIRTYKEKIIMHDQDVLNAVLYNERKWVPLTYNFQSGFIYLPPFRSHNQMLNSEIESVKHNPAVIHYVSSSKPWNINCFFTYRTAWRYYWRKTEWYKEGLREDNPKGIKGRIRNFLLRNDIFFPDKYYEKIFLKN